MAQNYETKVYAGGVLNRINRITLRSAGAANVSYNSNFTGQTNLAGSGISGHSVIVRWPVEPPTERPLQNGVKENDV